MADFSVHNSKYPKVHAVDRYMAKGLDLILIAVIALILSVLWYPVGALGAIAYAFFHDGFNGGASVGKTIIGLKVIKFPDEKIPLTWKDSAMRNISIGLFAIFAVIPMIGWILMFLVGIPLLIFEAYLIYNLESGYRLGDILAGTRVVSVRELKRESANGDADTPESET
ncbi:MAG: RDD family protein [Pseudomonadota bacterium]